MSISRRTVSTHVSNIYRKLKMASRVELAAEIIHGQHPDRAQSEN
ncbi:LuxR C-terminal-related transcriptional regulator [Streptomyces virginiae]|nr:LuxR C-terminal-related transcriptional regulator [Streptomyces virginiae]MCX5175393.1 LuxR C-terminal-related transcriptional regulator [Streptomyces virginiae]